MASHLVVAKLQVAPFETVVWVTMKDVQLGVESVVEGEVKFSGVSIAELVPNRIQGIGFSIMSIIALREKRLVGAVDGEEVMAAMPRAWFVFAAGA